MGCKHNWEILSEQVLPSAFEQMKATDFHPSSVNFTLFTKKYICIVACKCGKIKKFVETN